MKKLVGAIAASVALAFLAAPAMAGGKDKDDDRKSFHELSKKDKDDRDWKDKDKDRDDKDWKDRDWKDKDWKDKDWKPRDDHHTPSIPEPGTYALMLAGLAGVAFVARRRRNR